MQKWNNIGFMHFFEKLMPLCLALFFVRTVFMGYKYLFFLLLVPCGVFSVYALFKQKFVLPNLKRLLLPLLVIALFFVHFTPISNGVKESVNNLLILYFIVFSKLYYTDDKCYAFLNWIVRFTLIAGCIAIVKCTMSVTDISIPLSDIIFEGEGIALVNDVNFYSLFFIIAILVSSILLNNKIITNREYLFVNIVAVINIVAGLSRRAYILYSFVIVVMLLMVMLKKYDFKKSLQYNLLTISTIVICGVALFFCSCAFYTPDMPNDKKNRYYKMYSLFNSDMSYREFNIKQLRKYYSNLSITDSTNLFYNGFLQNGLMGWEAFSAPNDCINFGMVECENGDSAIRVARGCSSGYWQVHYKGRPIFYHKDVTYEISFLYRVIAGEELPFYVGWGINEGKIKLHKLPMTIELKDSVWKKCQVIYTFQEDHINPHCFLNCLQAGSTIDVKDIRLTCDDTTGLPRYVDQLPDSVIHKYYSKDTINYFTASRTDRWRYALELWQTRYNTKQKIFGQGFNYLEWYGQKFWGNPKRYDFPHNPIISSFLYSGIIGGIVYIIFLLLSLWLYWKRRKELGIFFVMYLCCMFFSMFSGSSHFSFPLFAFLSFLPFVEAGRKTVPVTEK